MSSIWLQASRRLPASAAVLLGGIAGGTTRTTTTTKCEAPPTTATAINNTTKTNTHTTSQHYWHHDANEFDIYLKTPRAEDLPILLQGFQAGQEVWPWIWTQPNEDGPHFVFVGALNDQVLAEIRDLLKDSNNNNNNVLIVASQEQLDGVPKALLSHCGVVTGASITLLNQEARMIMLDDERVISFDKLTVS